jgi:hypothetical protein
LKSASVEVIRVSLRNKAGTTGKDVRREIDPRVCICPIHFVAMQHGAVAGQSEEAPKAALFPPAKSR